ncbi:MAG: hypothetical protein SNG60_03430 [Rikenellaceae bacterium]
MNCASDKRGYVKPMIDILELDIEDAVLAGSGTGTTEDLVGGGSIGDIPDFMQSSTTSTTSTTTSTGNSDIWGN